MSRPWWLVFVSSLAVAFAVLARPARAEQPALPPPPAPTPPPGPAPAAAAEPPAPEAGPAAPTLAPAPTLTPAEQPQPQQGPPPTSEYPPLPPVASSHPAPAPAMPRGTAPPGATPTMQLPPPPPKRFTRYPITVMIADAAWIVAATQQIEDPIVFLGGYIVAAPVAHLLMGNPRSAWISAGLRAGAVAFTTTATFYAVTSNCYECETEIGLVAVGLIGAATIMVADWTVLAKREIPAAVPVQPRSAPDWAVTPQVQVGQGGLQLGLGGWF
jgi:hypothetical protein